MLTNMFRANKERSCENHRSYATPSVPWCEFFVASDPGITLANGWRLPGQAVPADGWLVPSDGPGFGLEVLEEWLVS